MGTTDRGAVEELASRLPLSGDYDLQHTPPSVGRPSAVGDLPAVVDSGLFQQPHRRLFMSLFRSCFSCSLPFFLFRPADWQRTNPSPQQPLGQTLWTDVQVLINDITSVLDESDPIRRIACIVCHTRSAGVTPPSGPWRVLRLGLFFHNYVVGLFLILDSARRFHSWLVHVTE